MAQYINKYTLVAKIKDMKGCKKSDWHFDEFDEGYKSALEDIFSFLDTLEVIDPYEQLIQYSSIEDGIKAHAEEYSFNIESELFMQLTPEQQKLWRKEIEQAVISGGHFSLEHGLNTQRSNICFQNFDDLFGEDGIDHYSKDVKLFKECYYTALEKLKEKKEEEV